ncbi:hypothetical protein CRG98_035251 [Punica granatum]|uniref:Peptidase A2 domain-containing protein n=1 Tax=Punica granatum TaxID=22663 RepID=A0A2I0IKX2_PUNGR|nr:hypothetical protein CRG98_035251 [Punica granatum]
MVSKFTVQKWLIKITLIINHDLRINATALFDTGADENCINEQIIPAKFYEKTTESLSSVSGTKLDIRKMATPWFDQENDGSSLEEQNRWNFPLNPKKQFQISQTTELPYSENSVPKVYSCSVNYPFKRLTLENSFKRARVQNKPWTMVGKVRERECYPGIPVCISTAMMACKYQCTGPTLR